MYSRYAVPPQYYATHDRWTSPSSPLSGSHRLPTYTMHSPTAGRGSPQSSQRRTGYESPHDYVPHRQQFYWKYPSQNYAHMSSKRVYEYASSPTDSQPKTRKPEAPRTDNYPRAKQSPRPMYDRVYTEEYLPAYDRSYRYSPPPQEYTHRRSHQPAETYHHHESYNEQRPRTQRQTHTSKPAHPPSTPRATATRHHRTATDEDVRRAGIPPGYSTKDWDPREEPVLLLGSVFDANSLGKWIYDWTTSIHGPATPTSEIAGDLWLLLIQLAGKAKRAEKALPRLPRPADRELVEEFLDAGERLWRQFSRLLKIAETAMLRVAKKARGGAGGGGRKAAELGRRSGRDFVDVVFGRDRELPRTEKVMAAIRLWSMRFDANCEDVLQGVLA